MRERVLHALMEPLLKTSEAAALLRFSPAHVRLLHKHGVLGAVRIGERGHLRFRRSDVEDLLKAESPARQPGLRMPVDVGDEHEVGV